MANDILNFLVLSVLQNTHKSTLSKMREIFIGWYCYNNKHEN